MFDIFSLKEIEENEFDIILLDVMMPKISGFDMLDILRSTTETRGIKIIMIFYNFVHKNLSNTLILINYNTNKVLCKQKVPLYVTKSTLIAYSISLFIGNCGHLKDIKYFKRYKNLLKYFIKRT